MISAEKDLTRAKTLVDQELRDPADQSCLQRVETLEMQRALSRQPSFSRVFLSDVLTRSARVEEDLVDQLFNSTEKRLARLLLLLANFGKEGRPEPVAAKITQELLAEMIGTTRSRVSHFMNKFSTSRFHQLQWPYRSPQFAAERCVNRPRTQC